MDAAEANPNARLETFCDGVFAIALTLLIIDIKLSHEASIRDTAALWRALQHLLPSVLAFVLSFCVILITWVNHHAALKLVSKSSSAFVYANGFLLLTVVVIPFPTALLGEFLMTDHAAPAVVLYNAVLAVQALSWISLSGTALGQRLTKSTHATALMQRNNKSGYFALALYSLFAVAGFWFPLTVAIITTLSWLFWLGLGIRMKHA